MAYLFVTGGHGFLGARLVAALRTAGDSVVAPAIEELDLADSKAFGPYEGSFDGVVHAAAFVPSGAPSAEDIPKAQRSSALACHNVLNFARQSSVKRFVYISSSDIYAPSATLPVSENEPTGPVGPAAVYALGKLWGEQITRVHADTYGLNTVALRFSILYGPGMRDRGALATFWKRAGASESIDVRAPDASNDYLHVDDAVHAICLALKHPDPLAVYNIGGGREVKLGVLARTICRVRGVDEARIVWGNAPGRRFCLDTTRARESLGFDTTFDIEAGLRTMLAGGK